MFLLISSASPPKERFGALAFPLNWNNWIRQTHRWVSTAFMGAVIVNAVAVARGKYTPKLGLLALVPLTLLLLSGLYLFVLPYTRRPSRSENPQ